MSEQDPKKVHDDWVNKLAEYFLKQGYRVIKEGEMFSLEGWKEPDLILLKGTSLEAVVEVIVMEPYENADRSVLEKCKKIRDYISPPQIIVFEPVQYLDKTRLSEKVGHYQKLFNLQHAPKSYSEIEQLFAEKWERLHNLNVTFWNEENVTL